MKTLKLLKTNNQYEPYEPEDQKILATLTGIKDPVIVTQMGKSYWSNQAKLQGYSVVVLVA